ncbi:hypothetical protein LguiA_010191 [Lonicera macranthoides]
MYVMHQKKSEIQIGKESSCISSDFNPLLFPSSCSSSIHDHHPPQQIHTLNFPPNFFVSSSSSSSSPPSSSSNSNPIHQIPNNQIPPTQTAPHKRPLTLLPPQFQNHNPISNSLSKPIHNYTTSSSSSTSPLKTHYPYRLFQLIHRLKIHLRLVLLLSLPFFYFLVSHPTQSFLLNFISAFSFSSVLLFSLNLPSIRLFFSSRPPLPVFRSIRSKFEKRAHSGSGCWVQSYGNGDAYEGEFSKGKSFGSGVYYYYMSGKYEGDWVDGKYDGYGVETWARGSRYRGQYRQGHRHGFGVYRFYTGDVYAGQWANGQSHGCGVHTCEDSSRYVGEFKWGVKHGLGHYHFRNGDTYAGEYFADKMHGFGVYTFANGHRYEGAWHEGRRQGLGMYTFRNGETQSGQWQNGILEVPSTQNATYPVSPVAVYHSKVLNAVQEARRAAQKAYDVGKVDERVSRAVAAANRAGNAARSAAVKAVQKQMHLQSNSSDIPLPILSTQLPG